MTAVTAPAPAPAGSRFARVRDCLTPGEWASVGGMSAFVIMLHVVGWGVLIGIVAPHHYQVSSNQVFGVGLGLTAYTLGMRHAFDADHIAAIDNTTRKLMADGKRPVSVGFWFSLGHSSIVFALCVLLAAGVRALAGQVGNGTSTLHSVTGLVGTAISGAFLFMIGILNLVVLRGILRVFGQMRSGEYDEAALQEQLNNRGFMNRILGGATKAVRKSWHMYPVGLLFGLGFDTATEVGLLVLAGGAAAFSLPWYAILTLPILFAAGMSLLDSMDGCFMNFAYGWAFSKPVRKVYYNITITGLSVAVALIIGTIELVSILTDRLDIRTGPLAAIGNLNLNMVGFAIVGMFILTWVIALAVWKFGRIEEKWNAHLLTGEPATD
jgi:high-affinity nickel-transport protein